MQQKINFLWQLVTKCYEDAPRELPFHGLSHINFVAKKALVFAEELNANKEIVEAAAIIHDLNYLTKTEYNSPEIAKDLRVEMLARAGFNEKEIDEIESTIMSINTWSRDENISIEAKALSDADMLFSSLPIIPVFYTKKYLEETGQDIKELSETILKLRKPLLKKGIYFYTNSANNKYLKWAKLSIDLFTEIQNSMEDKDILNLINND